MKLFYATNLTQLFLGDAAHLDAVPDNSIDGIITDPPYGINYVTGHRKPSPHSAVSTNFRFTPIDGDKRFPAKLIKDSLWEAYRVLKQKTAIYIFSRWDVQDRLINLVEELFTVRNVITWGKDNWTAGDLEGNYAFQTENIIYATKGDHQLRGKRDTNLLFFRRVDGAKLVHPAQKPVSLLSFLITKSSDEGDIILDYFVGSGSTCVAAESTRRHSIGVDISEKNLVIAKRRLEHKMLPMFDTIEVVAGNFMLDLKGDGE